MVIPPVDISRAIDTDAHSIITEYPYGSTAIAPIYTVPSPTSNAYTYSDNVYWMDWNEDGKLELPLAGSSERSENLIIGGDFADNTLDLAAEKGSVPAIDTGAGARIDLYEGTNRNWLRTTTISQRLRINDSYDTTVAGMEIISPSRCVDVSKHLQKAIIDSGYSVTMEYASASMVRVMSTGGMTMLQHGIHLQCLA